MIVDRNTAAAPRRLRTAVWIAVIGALPFGIAYCGRPDTPSIPDGETTETVDMAADAAAQAGDGDGDGASEDRRTARFNQFRRDLRARVAAGEITAEQARQRVSRMRQRMEAAGGGTAGDRESADQPSGRDGTERMNQALRDLRGRLEAGEITEEQYQERLAGIRRRMEAAGGRGRGRS